MIRRVVLVGLSGTGKSSVGRLAASQLGWDLVDTDEVIECQTGRSIPVIFREDGEAAFRRIEHKMLVQTLSGQQSVIATGGGAVVDSRVWASNLLGASDTLVIWLDAEPITLVERLRAQAASEGGEAERPLLGDGDPLERLTVMRALRAAAYAGADIALSVDNRTVHDIAGDIAELARLGRGEESRLDLRVEHAQSAIHIGSGARFRTGELIRHRWPNAERIWVATDANLQPHVEAEVESLTTTSGKRAEVLPIAPGESSKSLGGLTRLYDWMLSGGAERGDVVVAMGGGMVGDLAGFAAATVLRGIGLVQMPSTLLAMVDSGIGGKTGINHASGKNLIGAFYQPSEVVIDPDLLGSLPPRELRSGWAEIIKHAIIEASTPGVSSPVLLDVLERNVRPLTALKNPIMPWLVRRNVSLKSAVVEADEREAGIRAILNFGHTIGHGIEAAGYSLLHGEAVAVGMCGVLSIARGLELIDSDFERRIRALIVAYGLPVHASVDPDLVRQMMVSDKKRAGGAQKWVLPVRGGGVTVTTAVPEDLVRRAIQSVTGPG